MLRKSFSILSVLQYCRINQVRHSALFVNGAKATEQFVYVTPHIDVSEQLNKDFVQDQLNKRKSNINLNKINDLLYVYKELKAKKLDYETKKAKISTELGKLIKIEPDSETINKLKIQIGLIKENIKKIKLPLWSAEEAAMVETLKLPNNLHSKTPALEPTLLYTYLSAPKNNKNHLKIGEEKKLINFIKNENYYLTNDAAVFELGAKFHFNSLLKKNNFIMFSNPDFVKSLIVEGCGTDHTNPDSSFILHHNEESKVNKDSRLHLTGAASLCSFLAYHTKNVIYPKVLPLKYFAMGRQYIPSAHKEDSLFHVSQSSVIELFVVTQTASDLDNMLEEMVKILKDLYTELGYHFRLSITPADKLQMWESLRVIIEMYSTSLDSYIEVGNISLSADYIPKRLMFTYVENKENKFPYLLSGTVLNVPKFLACVLEQDKDFELPELFRVEKWLI